MRVYLLSALFMSLAGVAPLSKALAQIVPTLSIGQTKVGSPGSKPDLYRFGGTAGTLVRLRLTVPGAAALTIYTPSGEEMVSARGNGTAILEAVLPLNDVYYIGVLRESAAQGYSLKSASVEPDEHLARAAEAVGYSQKWANGYTEVQCWIDPGNVIRITDSKGIVEEITIGRGGNYYHKSSKNGKTLIFSSNDRFEGDNVITTYKGSNGETKVRTLPLVKTQYQTAALSFSSYLCK